MAGKRSPCARRARAKGMAKHTQATRPKHAAACASPGVRAPAMYMAGMPLFAHAGREKLTPPPLSAPLKPIKFCGSKTRIPLLIYQGAQAPPHRAGFCLFCSAKHAKTRGKPHFLIRISSREKVTHRPPESMKFPMPAARHEKIMKTREIPPWPCKNAENMGILA